MKLKLVVIGGTGLIGSRTVAILLSEIVALAGVVGSMAAPIWTGRWRNSGSSHRCRGHR